MKKIQSLYLNNIKGITLISLVITIVILMILAGIAINLVIGDNGIIRRSITSKNQYLNSVDDEQIKINELYSKMLIATNDDSTVTINIKDLNNLIKEQINDELNNNLLANLKFNSVNDNSFDIYSTRNFSMPNNSTKKLSGESKFGTFDANGNLIVSTPGLYYISSSFIDNTTTSNQVYNWINVNSKSVSFSFEDSTRVAAPASCVIYANSGDTICPYLESFNSGSTYILNWQVFIYKLL